MKALFHSMIFCGKFLMRAATLKRKMLLWWCCKVSVLLSVTQVGQLLNVGSLKEENKELLSVLVCIKLDLRVRYWKLQLFMILSIVADPWLDWKKPTQRSTSTKVKLHWKPWFFQIIHSFILISSKFFISYKIKQKKKIPESMKKKRILNNFIKLH